MISWTWCGVRKWSHICKPTRPCSAGLKAGASRQRRCVTPWPSSYTNRCRHRCTSDVRQHKGLFSSPWRVAVAMLLMLSLGASAGWTARGTQRMGEMARLGREAAEAHSVFAADRNRPIEIGSENRSRLDRAETSPRRKRAGPQCAGPPGDRRPGTVHYYRPDPSFGDLVFVPDLFFVPASGFASVSSALAIRTTPIPTATLIRILTPIHTRRTDGVERAGVSGLPPSIGRTDGVIDLSTFNCGRRSDPASVRGGDRERHTQIPSRAVRERPINILSAGINPLRTRLWH
jgi:hypothetical protein